MVCLLRSFATQSRLSSFEEAQEVSWAVRGTGVGDCAGAERDGTGKGKKRKGGLMGLRNNEESGQCQCATL
jgi:hypothetical protein